MLEVKRRRSESFEAMLRRFSRRMQLSGQLRQAKRNRFRVDQKNKTAAKRSALRRLELHRHYDKLKKMGQLPEPTRSRRRS
ncbi:hypothetical protein HYW17_01700 [Candidatus Uhrbacteria bacterium]|nr:hypothetical protein [Candidatus Uhrbacteria bacterium]